MEEGWTFLRHLLWNMDSDRTTTALEEEEHSAVSPISDRRSRSPPSSARLFLLAEDVRFSYSSSLSLVLRHCEDRWKRHPLAEVVVSAALRQESAHHGGGWLLLRTMVALLEPFFRIKPNKRLKRTTSFHDVAAFCAECDAMVQKLKLPLSLGGVVVECDIECADDFADLRQVVRAQLEAESYLHYFFSDLLNFNKNRGGTSCSCTEIIADTLVTVWKDLLECCEDADEMMKVVCSERVRVQQVGREVMQAILRSSRADTSDDEQIENRRWASLSTSPSASATCSPTTCCFATDALLLPYFRESELGLALSCSPAHQDSTQLALVLVLDSLFFDVAGVPGSRACWHGKCERLEACISAVLRRTAPLAGPETATTQQLVLVCQKSVEPSLGRRLRGGRWGGSGSRVVLLANVGERHADLIAEFAGCRKHCFSTAFLDTFESESLTVCGRVAGFQLIEEEQSGGCLQGRTIGVGENEWEQDDVDLQRSPNAWIHLAGWREEPQGQAHQGGDGEADSRRFWRTVFLSPRSFLDGGRHVEHSVAQMLRRLVLETRHGLRKLGSGGGSVETDTECKLALHDEDVDVADIQSVLLAACSAATGEGSSSNNSFLFAHSTKTALAAALETAASLARLGGVVISSPLRSGGLLCLWLCSATAPAMK